MNINKLQLISVVLISVSSLPAYADSLSAPFTSSPQFGNALELLDTTQALTAVTKYAAINALLNSNTGHKLKLSQNVAGPVMRTTKFQHFYNGLEVEGSMAFYQVGKAGALVRNRVADFDLDTTPTLSQSEAMQIALSVSGGNAVSSTGVKLKILPAPQENSARLVYEMNVDKAAQADRLLIIDAHSGFVIANISTFEKLAPIEIYSAANQGINIVPVNPQDPKTNCTATDLSTGQVVKSLTSTECKNWDKQTALLNPAECQLLLDGDPQGVDVTSCNVAIDQNGQPQGADDASADRAEQNSQAVLNYYQTHHNRNSYDGNGALLVSVVHGGLQFDNAFWNTGSNVMLYGDGDGKVMGDFTNGVDVAGHEMTHGVTSQTAKLTMMGESGALNEANSDFFGIMIANGGTNWVLGQQLFLQPSTNGQENAVRDLANPGNISFCAAYAADGSCSSQKPDPTTMAEEMPVNETCDDSNDNCWVHINATILGHAAYLVSQAIGPANAEQLYYAALTQSLSASDGLQSAAAAYKSTCAQLFTDANTCSQVTAAFAQVGL